LAVRKGGLDVGILAALGTVIAGFIVGGALAASGHWVLGMAIGLAAVPVALVVWVMAGDRL